MLNKRPTPDRIYVDSSFFVATQIINHPHHKRAAKLVELCKDSSFHYSLLTIDEIVYVLSKFHIAKKEIASIIREHICAIKNTRLISYNTNIKTLEEYATLWSQNSLAPRDALHAYFMKMEKLTYIATFDNDFRRNQKKMKIEVLTIKTAKGLK